LRVVTTWSQTPRGCTVAHPTRHAETGHLSNTAARHSARPVSDAVLGVKAPTAGPGAHHPKHSRPNSEFLVTFPGPRFEGFLGGVASTRVGSRLASAHLISLRILVFGVATTLILTLSFGSQIGRFLSVSCINSR